MQLIIFHKPNNDTLRFMVANGANVNHRMPVRTGNVLILFIHSFHPSLVPQARATPLMAAIGAVTVTASDNIRMVNELVRLGADIDQASPNDDSSSKMEPLKTPFMQAVCTSSTAIFVAVLSHGATISKVRNSAGS